MDFTTFLGVHRHTFKKYANSNTAFEELTPCIEQKKTASNRWEAREVKLLEDNATNMFKTDQCRHIHQDILFMFLSYP